MGMKNRSRVPKNGFGTEEAGPWAWWEVSEVSTEVAGGLFVSK